MTLKPTQKELLKKLPAVDRLKEQALESPDFKGVPKSVITGAIRLVLDSLRNRILNSDAPPDLSEDRVRVLVEKAVSRKMSPNLKPLVNGTGVVVHTNLGRSLLAPEALERINQAAVSYSNLEFNLKTGKRGLRYSLVEDLITEISGAEAAMAVNNNAGAVLLCLDTLARGKNVLVSRGELVEIGGSFRIPDVMAKSGAILKEVGTTNRTHLKDYKAGLDEDTALMLKVHKSNYAMVGFTKEVSLKDLVELGRQHNVPVMEDLGSGTFVDFSLYGFQKEPTVSESVAAGTDLVTFSGDKLLGGPQAGLIVGKKAIVEQIRQNPLTRALRIDKLTLAGLEGTLRLYLDPESVIEKIPTLRLMTRPKQEIEAFARDLLERIEKMNYPGLKATLLDGFSKPGGGALPLVDLPTRLLALEKDGFLSHDLELFMRNNDPPIIGRIEDDRFLLDLRTVLPHESAIIESAVKRLARKAALHETDLE